MPALMDEGVRSALSHSSSKGAGGGRKGSYMSTMAELRGGLTEGQRAHAANQRRQLQQDLEQQVRTEVMTLSSFSSLERISRTADTCM